MPRPEDFHREQVLTKIQNVFWIKGYNGTSMQDLVDASGLNRSSIYNSFGNKMELYKLVLKNYQHENKTVLDQICSNKNGLASIQSLFDVTIDYMINDKERKGCMFINCNTEMGNQNILLQEITKNNQETLVQFFKDLIEKGKKDGSIQINKDSITLAYYLVSSFQGLRITGMNTKNRSFLESIVENIIKTIT
ncbi:TetR/AcrR family transcriptional regulator [Aquimarina agarilytica]|uniref:TetR/AcrR family transcriptional regulator n=1 Tax=Aquimarina agarilytica TaxID=1087449 RepID=UPI0002897C3C|nr:TetR/AcrR family transcriptional regulator [Aquimarina agarilytica]